MIPDDRPWDRAPRDLLAWLAHQRATGDPSELIFVRDVNGHIAIVLPRNGREVDDQVEDDAMG
jgi:hypothetical protein